MRRVLPGEELVLARDFRPTRLLIKVDLPTLDRPAKAMRGNLTRGYSADRVALVMNDDSTGTEVSGLSGCSRRLVSTEG